MPTSQRNVSWIELFFDLIFVAATHQLTIMLSTSTSIYDAITPILLFIPILWCWISHTLFTNLFTDRSWFYQFTTILQIFGTIVLVVLMPTAMYEHIAWFAYAYVFVKAVLVIQYLVWSILEIYRFLDMLPVIIGNLGSGLLWALSIFSDQPYWWWAGAMVIDLLTPVFTKTKSVAQKMNPHHLPERLGLLTVIVLGQMIISLILGSFEVELTREVAWVLAAGVLLTFLIFWTYFRFIDLAIVGYDKSTSRIYLYSHIPLVIGLVCVAAGFQGVLVGGDESYLLVLGIILFALSQRFIKYIVDQRFLKRQLFLVALLLVILGWYYFFARGALINLAVLSGAFAAYLILAEYILGWNDYSEKNAPDDKMRWDNDK